MRFCVWVSEYVSKRYTGSGSHVKQRNASKGGFVAGINLHSNDFPYVLLPQFGTAYLADAYRSHQKI